MLDRFLERVGKFSYRFRYLILVLAVLIFTAVSILQSFAGISYSYSDYNRVTDVFPEEDTLVILYENRDEEGIASLTPYLLSNEHITEVNAYSTTIGMPLTESELVAMLSSQSEGFDEETVLLLYQMLTATGTDKDSDTVTLEEFLTFITESVLNDASFADSFTSEAREQLLAAKQSMEEGKALLVGREHSRMTVTLDYPPESEEIYAFYSSLEAQLDGALEGEYRLIGSSAMSNELSKTFKGEYLFISLITAAAIFLVVLIACRRLIIPILLVSIIECAVFITLTTMAVANVSMYFIALIIVQCILMGAMVDYGILLSNYYVEVRREYPLERALPEVLKRSIRAIATSAVILIAVTLCCGLLMTGAVASILLTLCIGAFSALLLVIFVLPSLLAIFDRAVTGRKDKNA